MTNTFLPFTPQAALVDLSLDAVALCGEGANSRADIILHKGKEKMRMPKTFEELMKALDDEAAATITKHINELVEANKATVEALQGEINTLKTAAPAPAKATQTQEDVLKEASPAVRELFEKMQGQMNQLLAAQEADMVEKRYQLCKSLPCDEQVLRDVLKSASPATVEVLTKAAAAITKGLHRAVGSDASGSVVGSSADDAYAALEKSARNIAAEQGITFEKAFTEACYRDPDTYKKYVEGVK